MLAGITILNTRPKADQGSDCPLSLLLREQGASVIHIPLVTTQPTLSAWPGYPAPPPDRLFFTSPRAVTAFMAQHPPGQPLPPAGAVGPETARTLSAHGVEPAWQSSVFDAATAARMLAADLPPESHVLWPCGNRSNPNFQTILEESGHRVTPMIVYKTLDAPDIHPAFWARSVAKAGVITFTSPSAVHAGNRLLQETRQAITHARLACLGPSTAAACTEMFGRADIIADPHTLSDLVKAIGVHLTDDRPSLFNPR